MLPSLSDIEAADIAVAKAAAPIQETRIGRAVGSLGTLADQPPLRALGLGVIALAVWRDDARLAGTGARMLAAHTLATLGTTLVKREIDRSRPSLLIEQGYYQRRRGHSRDGAYSSFPSGHAGGVAAMAAAAARDYPAVGLGAALAALALTMVQIPRRAHFVSDVTAGIAIGLLSEAALATVWPGPEPAAPTGTKRAHRPY